MSKTEHHTDWRQHFLDAVTDPLELLQLLRLPEHCISMESAARYPLFVTRSFLSHIEPKNPQDPLLLQVLPQHEELIPNPDFYSDPLQELSNSETVPDCLQKYPDRLLVLANDSCAVHCRFCFRRHFPQKKRPFFQENQEKKLTNLHVPEVILSGGDPLMLDNAALEKLLYYMEESPSVNRVRIHTRLPIMIPKRINDELLAIFQKFCQSRARRAVYVVLHVNHPHELSDEVLAGIAKLIDSGFPVLSQSVLLRNVNDSFETLAELFVKLVDHRITPYYLHQLDRVAGAAHFEVSVEIGRKLVRQLRDSLSGYAVPRYVREIPGQSGKRHLV